MVSDRVRARLELINVLLLFILFFPHSFSSFFHFFYLLLFYFIFSLSKVYILKSRLK